MYIEEWNAHVTVRQPHLAPPNPVTSSPARTPIYARIPKLCLCINMRCPVSGCSTEACMEWSYPMHAQLLDETPPRPGFESELTHQLKKAIEEIGLARYCDSCGIPSIVPPAQLEQWGLQLLEKIDLAWLQSCSDELADWLSRDGRKPPQRMDELIILRESEVIMFARHQ